MERIRAEAIEGFNRTGAGGFEIGGVLFGSVEGDVVRILAHRPFSCEYAMGPAFMLSERDLERFQSLIGVPERDPDLRGLRAVGWYHSHTRHGVYLSERDLETHNRFFPGGNFVALVVRPDIFGSVRAGFFFRERDGAIRADSSYCEFDIAPPQRPAGFELPRIRPEPELPPLPPMPGLGLPEVEEDDEPRPARRGFPWVAVLFALVVALAAAAAALYYGILLPRPSMSLVVKDLGGPVRISWDRSSRPIAGARGGILEIFDGGKKEEMEIDPVGLHDGSVIYTPSSSTIDVHLKVERGPGDTHEESVRFVGPPRQAAVETAPPAPVAEPAPPPAASVESPADAPGQVQDQASQQVQAQPTQKTQQKPRPEEPKTLARFSPPAAAQTASGSVLPAPPPLDASGAKVAQSAAAQLVEKVPGPPPSLPPPERPKPVFTGPSRGRLIWTGEVRSNVPIEINGKSASYGTISGELPGFPVQIQVHPADLTSRGLTVFTLDPTYRRTESAVEAPGPQNGWNPTIYTWNAKRARSVTVTEAPSPQNHWKGLTLRGDIDWTPVIIIDWQAIPQR